MATRAEMSEVRREAVLTATAALLDEVGVAALTIRDVARRAGVAQGSVFLYAENKADLVNQVYGQRIADEWHRLFDRLASRPPLDRVEEFYLGCVDVFYGDLENVQALYRALEGHQGRRLESVDLILARVRGALGEAAAEGALRPDIDVEVLALSYQGLYSNVIPLARLGTEHSETRRIIGESLRQLRLGITPR